MLNIGGDNNIYNVTYPTATGEIETSQFILPHEFSVAKPEKDSNLVMVKNQIKQLVRNKKGTQSVALPAGKPDRDGRLDFTANKLLKIKVADFDVAEDLLEHWNNCGAAAVLKTKFAPEHAR